jgi:hypothetical protein
MLKPQRRERRERIVRGERPEPGAVVVKATLDRAEPLVFTVRNTVAQEARALIQSRLNLCCGVRVLKVEALACG